MENTKTKLKKIEPLTQRARFIALGINIVLAGVVFYIATGDLIPTGSGASVWFLAVTAHWLLTLIAAPFFLPPRDSFGTAVSVFLLLAPLDLSAVGQFQSELIVLNNVTLIVSGVVAICAFIAIFQQGSVRGTIAYRLSSILGKGEVLFTPAVIISAIGFYQTNIGWMTTILALWTIFLAVRPAELVIQLISYLRANGNKNSEPRLTGSILRVDDPNLIRISIAKGVENWVPDVAHIAQLPNGKSSYVIPLFTQIQNDEVIGTGLCCSSEIGDVGQFGTPGLYVAGNATVTQKLLSDLSGEDSENQKIVGIVVEGSTISEIRFQVVKGAELEEGMVVYAIIRGKKVFYQILNANTCEELFQSNPFGLHVASASQIGCYDKSSGFKSFPWLPDMNQPLFISSSKTTTDQVIKDNECLIGEVPNTPFGVPVVIDDLIEYHTAVLGITGTGKTELSLDLIRKTLERGAKVFCVDLTGEYKARLKDSNPQAMGLPEEDVNKLEKLLFDVETGEFRAGKEKQALKACLDDVRPNVETRITEFLEDSKQKLGIFELTEITNTKATLRITELYISAIMHWARKYRKREQIMIVLEEAHTIIPEIYSSGFDAETQWVVGRIGQIALQGRKYGVGLLIVSQRTALVSKTILSQCNTYFTHALVDKTSLDYLSGFYSSEHIKAIPNLRFLEFIAQGKGIKSEKPLLARRKYDESKKKESQSIDYKNE